MMKTNRLSVVPKSLPLQTYADKLYVHRFYQDVYEKMFHYSNDKSLLFTVTPDEDKTIETICTILANTRAGLYSRHNNREVGAYLKEFISTVASDLAYYGISYWEIVSTETSVSDKLKSSELFRIIGNVEFVNGKYRQVLNPTEQNSFNKEFIVIPKACVWKFELPTSLGEQESQENLIEKLANLSDIFPKFYSDEQSKGSLSKDFDLKLYSRQRDIELAKITRSWGWTIGYGEDWTGYYFLYRQLKFKASLSRLRESILEGLNNLFKQLELNYKVTTNELKSAEEIENYIEQLKSMELSFEDAQQFLYKT